MIVDSSHLISSPWLKYAWVSSMWSGGGSSHHELIIYCLNVHHVNTKILLDNPGDLCTSHDKQRKICRTWFVEYCLTSAPVSLEMLFLFEHYGCLGYGCCRVEYRNHNCSSLPLEPGLLSYFEKISLPPHPPHDQPCKGYTFDTG